MNINKTTSNYVLLVLLVSAFITMQWTVGHTYLTKQHSRNGAQNQNQIAIHTRSVTNQTNIGFLNHNSRVSNVNFNHDYGLLKKEIQKKLFTVTVGNAPFQPLSLLQTSIKIALIDNAQLKYLDRSTINPRASPLTS